MKNEWRSGDKPPQEPGVYDTTPGIGNPPYRPHYYQLRVQGVEIDVFDIADAAGLSPPLTMALKYVIRAGKKGAAEDDIEKAIRCLTRAMELST